MRMLLIADLHIGSIKDTKYMYDVTTAIVDQEVMFNKCDAIIFLGDYFHRLFKVNEEYVSCAINIMSHIIKCCARRGTKIRMIYGTESHEMNQYKLFNHHMTSGEVDIRVIDTVTDEELFPGIKVLYIPEEYVTSKRKFYKKYLDSNTRYDYIFGHGIIEDGMPAAVSFGAPKSDEKQVPRFKSGELAAAGNLTVFGHYHCYTDMNNNVYYLGSLFRDSFGEEGAKGYGIVEDGQLHFVENRRAYVFKTYEFSPTHEIYKSADSILSEIKRVKEENPSLFDGTQDGKIRLVFRTPENLDPSFRENLKDILVNEKQVVPLIKANNDVIMAEAKEEIAGDDKYAYLIDPSLKVEDKLHRYLVEEYDSGISMTGLKKYIGLIT